VKANAEASVVTGTWSIGDAGAKTERWAAPRVSGVAVSVSGCTSADTGTGTGGGGGGCC
jgi:hypothetical protein